nr:PREDICTED: leupaxin [Opisthocomus hoazin]
MEDLDALLAELEQSSRPASEDHVLQAPSSCKQDPATARPPAAQGREPPPSATLKVQPSPRAQVLGEALKTVYSPIPAPQPLLPSSPPTAAAQQLDELLANLGHLQNKLAAAGHEARVPAEPEPSLDTMLGSLTRDLQELGITAVPTGTCAACRKPIAGKVSPVLPCQPPSSRHPLELLSPAPASSQVLTALGKTWHPEHFACARCGEELGGQPFFERGGRAYCEEDYHQAFSPRCAYCAGPVREKVLTALDQTWHPEHFFCAHCGKAFGDDGKSRGTELQKGTFRERGDKMYCQACHDKLFL